MRSDPASAGNASGCTVCQLAPSSPPHSPRPSTRHFDFDLLDVLEPAFDAEEARQCEGRFSSLSALVPAASEHSAVGAVENAADTVEDPSRAESLVATASTFAEGLSAAGEQLGPLATAQPKAFAVTTSTPVEESATAELISATKAYVAEGLIGGSEHFGTVVADEVRANSIAGACLAEDSTTDEDPASEHLGISAAAETATQSHFGVECLAEVELESEDVLLSVAAAAYAEAALPLTQVGPLDGQPAAFQPLDVQPPPLETILTPLRKKLVARIDERMVSYDKGRCFPRTEDSRYETRNGYELHLRGEALKEVHNSIQRYTLQGGRVGQLWKVVGGVDKGGILVRTGLELTSPLAGERLHTGSLVEEITLEGDCLNYRLISGAGPKTGWSSHLAKGGVNVGDAEKHLLVRTSVAAWEERHGMLDSMLTPRGHVIVIGLMAVHISTLLRADRLRRTLDSVRRQQLDLSGDTRLDDFAVGLSWSAKTPEIASRVREIIEEFVIARDRMRTRLDGNGPITVAIEQSTRHSQFQHLRAALAGVEEALAVRFATCSQEEQEGRSVWVVFGDDDDIWHPQRIHEYIRAIRNHPMCEGVGVFATCARVNCSGCTCDEDMPTTDREVDTFLSFGRGCRLDYDEKWQVWLEKYRRAGRNAYGVPLADDICLEYFDLCPRLRLVHEFFGATSESLIAHRYCDLRFCTFLVSYPRTGQEIGLEVSFLEPGSCWMYFYACVAMDGKQLEKSIEDVSGDVDGVIGRQGHMATEISIEKGDIQLAGEVLREFKRFEQEITVARLSRYWACFRDHMEVYLVSNHTWTIDQRLFDAIVYNAVNSSFCKFGEKVNRMPAWRGEVAAAMMYKIGQRFAKRLAGVYEVRIFWFRVGEFLEPGVVDTSPQYYGAPYQHHQSPHQQYQSPYQQYPSPYGHSQAGKVWHPGAQAGRGYPSVTAPSAFGSVGPQAGLAPYKTGLIPGKAGSRVWL